MNYEKWRDDIFGQAPNADPMLVGLLQETYALPKDVALGFINRALIDPEIHRAYSKEQIGIGLQILYSNSYSDFPFCYISAGDEDKRVVAIKNLRFLYENFFERYCTAPVSRVRYGVDDGEIGSLCYMLWDIFVLHPHNASKEMVDAAVDVMKGALNSSNDNCIVSAIHGLGHWVRAVPSAVEVLENWLKSPTTQNIAVCEYAVQAKTGYIQ